MSIIASTYNTGTGLSVSVAETTLPPVVDDLTVNGNLIVIETTVLNGQTTINNNLNIAGTTTSNNAVVNNNLIITNGIGQNSSNALLKLPLNNGIDGQVLTILNDAVTPITTSWKTPVNDYVQFNTTTNKLSKIDFSGTAEISNLVLSNTIGLSSTQKFILPLNSNTAILNSVLTLTNTTSKKTSWEPLPVQITDYTNYNSTNKTLISNVSGTPTTISDIQLTTTGQTGQKFQLPSNTSTALNNSILSIDSSTKNTTWISDYLDYNSTTTAIENNVTGSGVAITNLQLTTIGQSGQKFQLPSNTSTALNNSILSINSTTKNTTWEPVPLPVLITDYTNYNSTNKTLISNVSGTPTTITDIQLTTIGQSGQKFQLPFNTSSTTTGSHYLTINNTTKNSYWSVPFGNVSYNGSSYVLSSEDPSAGILPITDIQMTTIGQLNQKFVLPSNTSTATAGSVLRLNNASTKTTDWVVPAMIPTTTETSITTGVATASAATVEMCRASNLTAGTYLITYYVDLDISTTTRVFSYRSYGISTAVGSLTSGAGIIGLCVGDSVPYTAPVVSGTTPVRYIGSGVCVLTATTTLYLLVRFVYTGTTFNTKGTLRVTKLA